MTAGITRRGVLPILAGLPLASPLSAAVPAMASDAVLISAEVEAVEAEGALAAIFATAFEDTPAEDEADRLSARWRAALDRMADTPALGFAGLAAKARSVERLARQSDIETVAQLAPSLAADVLRLGRIAG